MKDKGSYQERLKKMKRSIEKNKGLLESEFPEDVTRSGSPDLIRKQDNEIDSDTGEDSDEKQGRSKKS